MSEQKKRSRKITHIIAFLLGAFITAFMIPLTSDLYDKVFMEMDSLTAIVELLNKPRNDDYKFTSKIFFINQGGRSVLIKKVCMRFSSPSEKKYKDVLWSSFDDKYPPNEITLKAGEILIKKITWDCDYEELTSSPSPYLGLKDGKPCYKVNIVFYIIDASGNKHSVSYGLRYLFPLDVDLKHLKSMITLASDAKDLDTVILLPSPTTDECLYP